MNERDDYVDNDLPPPKWTASTVFWWVLLFMAVLFNVILEALHYLGPWIGACG